MVLAEALAADGDADGSTLELDTARATFERLGAVLDARTSTERLDALRRPATEGAVARRTFVFTDIVGSTPLLEAIGDNAWSDLRRWHDETLRRCVAHEGGEEVDHTGDGFFVSFPDVVSAVACAREIQRKLVDHQAASTDSPPRSGSGCMQRRPRSWARTTPAWASTRLPGSEPSLEQVRSSRARARSMDSMSSRSRTDGWWISRGSLDPSRSSPSTGPSPSPYREPVLSLRRSGGVRGAIASLCWATRRTDGAPLLRHETTADDAPRSDAVHHPSSRRACAEGS
jgi:hypothetical protein